MYKQSLSRNHRSKGIKVKHILQICVLVAVCFWLLYQVKHSHEKSKEFESKDEKVVGKLQSDSELQRFGRKDIPRLTEIATNVEKHDEDEDDEEDKENKHEEDETEREDARVAESEEERGGGDDEIDEHETEKTEEEEVDEDKEREEKESVTEENDTENEEHEDTHEEEHPEEEEEEESGKEDHTESEESDDVDKEDHGKREITSDDQDHDVERNTREAQEELYRADDASSEVTHNVQSISKENENVTMGQENEIYGKINFGQEHETNTSENVDELVKPEIQPREDVKSTAFSATNTEQKKAEVNLTEADDNSLQNSMLPKIHNNSTAVGEKLFVSLLSNGTQTLDSNLSQNGSIGIKLATDDKNKKEVGEDANKIENVNTNKTLASSDATNDNNAIKASKDSLVGDGSLGEKPEDIGKSGTDENSESHSSEGIEAIQNDPIDASDIAMLIQEEKESRTDLDTLPEIRSEIHDTEDAEAE